MRTLMWFREDLRLQDNTAFYHAARAAQKGVVAVYIISPEDWRLHDMAACRVDFILRNLQDLKINLAQLNIPLLVREVDKRKNIPQTVLNIMQEMQADALFINQQYEIDEQNRDRAVEKLLKQNNKKFFSYTDQVVLAPGEVLTAQENYFTVFTPFKNAWLKRFKEQKMLLSPMPKKQEKLSIKSDEIPQQIEKFISTIDPTLWPAGEQHAQQRLNNFIQHKIKIYHKQRDFPALDGTSTLSPYLTSGIISPRQCLQAALDQGQQNEGVSTWINELIWREFYKHVLYAFPRVSMHQAFKLNSENFQWENNKKHFQAWCEGKTGYPLIDAAMRQLNQTGWMHNRLRMLTAMFLVKDLLIDWRWGEKYFMQHLIDGDLAANNGGWQWCASTGTDAVPYFRIFNPTTQSEKFDPGGKFIRQYCPELNELDNKTIHQPAEQYIQPLVIHSEARLRFLQMYKTVADN